MAAKGEVVQVHAMKEYRGSSK